MMVAKNLAIKESMEISYKAKTPKFAAVNGAEIQINGIAHFTIEKS